MVFQAVEVLVSFATCLALVGLVFLHAECAGEWLQCLGVDNAEGAIRVCVEGLCIVAVLLQRTNVSKGQRQGLEASNSRGSCIV